jgi:hypothetical protein
MRRKLVLLFVVPVVTFLVLMLLRHPATTWSEEGRVISKRGPTLAAWASKTYVAVSAGLPPEDLETIKISSKNVHLDSIQLRELREAVRNTVVAYSADSYETYTKFRFPVTNGVFDRDLTVDRAKRLIAKDPARYGGLENSSPESVFHAFWSYWDATNNVFCTRCVQEVSIQNSEIVIEETDKIPKNLNFYVTSFANVGYFDRRPAFIFEPTPEKVIKNDGRLIYATFSILMKAPPDPPYPLFCRYYWVQEYKKWLPMELAGAYSPQKKWNFIF